MRYYRYGHAKDVFVKKGDTVKKGQKIGTIGDGNGQWSSHLHFDIPKKTLTKWTDYVFGMTKNAVRNLYADPAKHRKTVYPLFDHFGWKYLEKADYSGKYCYHPGEDLNGKGAGDSDKGTPFYSATNGIVVYCYTGTGSNGGWGKLIVIQGIKGDSSSKNAPTTKETEKVVSTPKEETNPPKIEDYGTGDRTTPNEIVLDGTGTTGTEKSTGPSIVYTAKPLDPPTQSRLERIINWFLEKWDNYRNTLKR